MFQIKTYNSISDKGLSRFPGDRYEVGPDSTNPDAYVIRSQKLHDEEIPSSVVAIARAGAGVNNVPVERCSEAGTVVFNTPGANANAVKELVMTGVLMGCRDIAGGVAFCRGLADITDEAELATLLEKEKKNFAGSEIEGKTLGVIGLGAIGAMVANAALSLGMKVIGHDPAISVEAAWKLSRHVEKMDSIEALLAKSDFITLHVPAIDATKDLINAERVAVCKDGAVILNFARGSVVDASAVLAGLESGKLKRHITDFPTAALAGHPKVVPMPHIGASTGEAEENCAVMAADQLMDYLENGNIRNSVNFPNTSMGRKGLARITFSNRNVPKVLGNVLSLLADGNINVLDMLNRSRGDLAYNLIDVEADVSTELQNAIAAVEGVINVRVI